MTRTQECGLGDPPTKTFFTRLQRGVVASIRRHPGSNRGHPGSNSMPRSLTLPTLSAAVRRSRSLSSRSAACLAWWSAMSVLNIVDRRPLPTLCPPETLLPSLRPKPAPLPRVQKPASSRPPPRTLNARSPTQPPHTRPRGPHLSRVEQWSERAEPTRSSLDTNNVMTQGVHFNRWRTLIEGRRAKPCTDARMHGGVVCGGTRPHGAMRVSGMVPPDWSLARRGRECAPRRSCPV